MKKRNTPVPVFYPYLKYLDSFVDGVRIKDRTDALRKVIAEHMIINNYVSDN